MAGSHPAKISAARAGDRVGRCRAATRPVDEREEARELQVAFVGAEVALFTVDVALFPVDVALFRLEEARALIQLEINAILSLGVELQTGKRLGKDFTLTDLKARGMRAPALIVAGTGMVNFFVTSARKP